MRLIVLTIWAALVLSACGKQPMEQFISIPDRTWQFNSPENFDVNITSPGVYKMLIQVRYTQEYSFSNIWVALDEKSPDGKQASMRMNIPLFDISGRPLGSFAGNFYDRSYPDGQMEARQLTLNFPAKGRYSFSIHHNMRIDKLDGISEIGIRLKEAE